ncbi:MAG: hypothetical protein U9N13_01735 [Euryarchaeota archaeon]|nr:hypothetical protein [Euryarchaeota archaeon]
MQQVHINRLGVNSIEFDSEILEIPLSPGGEHSFEIVIINYGSPTHVHLSASDEIHDNITFLDDNPYVAHEEYLPVIARIPFDGRLFNKGEINITVGYGSKTESFPVTIGDPGPARTSAPVRVNKVKDQSLSVERSSKRDAGSRGNNWSMQMSDITSHMVEGIHEILGSRLIVGVSAILFLFLIIYTILYTAINPLGSFSIGLSVGFYSAVSMSILFMLIMAYLLTRLPIFK